MFIERFIAAARERLTPAERRLAEAVLAEPTLLAFGSVSELADRVGTSRPSVVRFATKLGFDGYADLQEQVRSAVAKQLSRPSERIRHQESSTDPHEAWISTIGTLCNQLDQERLARLGKPLPRAPRVWIITGESSRAGAHALLSGLTMVRPGVHLVEEHTSGRDLSSAAAGDAAVVFDFARYRRHSINVARTLAKLGVDIVAVTDGPLSPLVSLTENWCEVQVPAVGPFDSSVPAVAVAELLVSYVSTQLGNTARERIDRTEALWETTGTFLS